MKTVERKFNNSSEVMEKIETAISQARAEYAAGKVKVTISNNNIKLEQIPSVSLPPFVTCPDICRETCGPDCYAGKLVNLRKTCAISWARNFVALTKTPDLYWSTVRAACMTSKYFRYHVSGDIPNKAYFENMVQIAREFPGTLFLVFTKRYSIVNGWIDENGDLPENLHVLFSEGWGIQAPNPHGLPTTTVYEKGSDVDENWILCGGNCAECACRGTGCWSMNKGETIAFQNHR